MQLPLFHADTSFSCKSCRSSANVFILVSIALFDHDRQESVSPRWNLEQLTVAMTFFVGIVCQFGVPGLIIEVECWVCVHAFLYNVCSVCVFLSMYMHNS